MSNDDHKAKADIEDVESEVGAAAEARSFVHAICKLVFLAPLDAKDTKGYVESHIVLYEHGYTRTEIERCLSDCSSRVLGFIVV